MKITTEVTERDKKLLLFMAVFVIVVVFGFFIIRPLAETDAALKDELVMQEDMQLRTQQKLMLLSSVEANVEKTEEELDAAAKEFYPVMKSQEIDKLLTEIVLKWGLDPKQLTIQMPESEMILEPFYASQAALEEALSLLWNICCAGRTYSKRRSHGNGTNGGRDIGRLSGYPDYRCCLGKRNQQFTG